MDKYLTYPGKQPVYLGDVDFLQGSVRDALKNLLRAYIGDNSGDAILLGCEISVSPAQTSWTAGIVSIDGEILPIEAGTLSGEGGDYFEIVSSTAGSRTFGDGASHDCFEYRQATISHTNTGKPARSFPRVAPIGEIYAKEFGFYAITNSASSYARLAFCGGAFHLSMRRPAMEASSTTVFQGTTDQLPDNLVQLFQKSTAPSGMMVQVCASILNAPIACVLSWSVSGKTIEFTLEALTAVQLTDWWLDVTLPVF